MYNKNIIAIIIATIGTLLEWAEYTFYGYLAFKISGLFFPEGNDVINLLKTYGIFAAGYIMRPLGAVLFGYIGDCFGRKSALMGAIFLMGLSTLGIGCLPIYTSIGIFAPIGLLLLRLLQGLAISGEYNGAGIFLIEQVGTHRPCFAGSFISAGAAGGMALGGLAAYLVSLPGAPDWAWRVPFMLGGVSCILGCFARHYIQDQPQYLKSKITEKIGQYPLVAVLKNHSSSFLKIFIIAAFVSVFAYIGNIYIVTFLKDMVGLPPHHAMFFAMAAEICAALLIPFMGYIADHHKKPAAQFKAGLGFAIISAPLMFYLAYTGNYIYISLAMLLFGISNAIVSGPTVKLLNDQFPVALRYTGISVAWNLSVAIFGGTSPMIAHVLVNSVAWWGPSIYISIMAFIVLAFLVIFRFQVAPPIFQKAY